MPAVLEKRAIEEILKRDPIRGDERVPFTVADVRGFMAAELPPPKFAVEGIIPQGVVTVFGAHGGSGKSVMGLIIAAHFAACRPWAGMGMQGGRAVFVSLEDSEALVLYRLRRIVCAYSLPQELIAENLIVLDGTDGDGSLGIERSEFGRRWFEPTAAFDQLSVFAEGAGLVVVDNASDAFDGNENERRIVRAFVRMLGRLARQNQAGVLLLAHVDKNAARDGAKGNSYSGSTAWHNSARSRLALKSENREVQLVQEKSNFGRLIEPLSFTWSDHGVLVPSTWSVAAEADPTDETDAESVLAALVEAAKHGVNVPVARMGPATAQKALETLDALPAFLRGSAGRVRFWRAVNRLQRDGCASPEEYRTPDRKVRVRFVIRPGAPVMCARQSPIPPIDWRAQGAANAPMRANANRRALARIGATCARCDGEGCTFCLEEAAV